MINRALFMSIALLAAALAPPALHAQPAPADYSSLSAEQARAQVDAWDKQYTRDAKFEKKGHLLQDGTFRGSSPFGLQWIMGENKMVLLTIEQEPGRIERAKGMASYRGGAMGGLPVGTGAIEFADGSRWVGQVYAPGATLAPGTVAIVGAGWTIDYLPRPLGLGAFIYPDGTKRYVRASLQEGMDWGYKIERVIHEEGPGVLPKVTGSASTNASAEAATRKAGETLRDCDTCPEMVVVPAGSFMMGSASTEEGRQNDEGPRHAIAFASPFAVGKFEVTFAEYDLCVAASVCPPVKDLWGRGKRPVINVTYDNAVAYTGWLSKTTGQKYFLLSEAEWEYAARAGSDTPWNTGEAIITDDANFLGSFGEAIPVGTYAPNAFGLYDMHGNVGEWTLDCYEKGYFGVEKTGGPKVSDNCTLHVHRGGGYFNEPKLLRSAQRFPLEKWVYGVGFRIARAL